MISDLNNLTDKTKNDQNDLIKFFEDYDNDQINNNSNFDDKFVDLEEIQNPVKIIFDNNINIPLNPTKNSINLKVLDINNLTNSNEHIINDFNLEDNKDLYKLEENIDEFSVEDESLINKNQLEINLKDEKEDDILREKLLKELYSSDDLKLFPKIEPDNIKSVKITDNNKNNTIDNNKIKKNIKKNEIINSKDQDNINIQQNTDKIKNEEAKEEIFEAEDIENIDEVEELESLESAEDVQLEQLIKNIDEYSDTVKNPGTIDLINLDDKMKEQDIEKEEKQETKDLDQAYGVNRVQVFYNIEKKLYSSKKNFGFSEETLSKVKKGLFLPVTVALSSFVVLFILLIIANIYISFSSKSTLEDNYFKDDSIMSLLSKQLNEERQLAMEKLEEEKKLLEEERKNRQNLIIEELQKKESEIENKYKQKLDELNNKGITKEEIENIKKKIEEEKLLEIQSARDQSKILEEKTNEVIKQKENELTEIKKNLEEKQSNIQEELEKIKQREDELKKKEEELALMDPNKKIEEKKAHNEQINNFNNTVYQLIADSMDDFKKRDFDQSLEKLNAVLQYYQSRIDFVKTDDNLIKKMDTDIYFVESIKALIDNSNKTTSKEYQQLIKKLDNIITFYKNAENYHFEKNYERSGSEYQKVLEEISEINDSYNKIKEIEKLKQNALAIDYMNKAKESLNLGKKNEAMNNYLELLKNAPLSDYVNPAILEIAELSKALANTINTEEQNKSAEPIMKEADKLKSLNQYEDSIKKYEELIINYPYSKYVKEAYLESQRLLKILSQDNNIKQYEKDLRNKFVENHNKYQEALKKDDFIEARNYYFNALQNAFNYFTDNSLNEFTERENKYISELIEKARLNELAQKDNKSIIDKYENELKEINNKIAVYEKNIQDNEQLIANLQNEINDKNSKANLNQKEKDDLITKYESDIKNKELEIDKLKQLLKDYETNKGFSQKEKDEMTAKYEKEINNKQIELDKLKAQIKNQDTNINNKVKDELIGKYEKDIKDKEAQIDKLKIYIKEQEKISNETERNKILKDYEEKLTLEKEKSNLLKKQLYEYLQRNNELNTEVGKYEKLIKDYQDLLVKYNELEKNYQNKNITQEERDKMQKDIENVLRKKLEKDKEKEIESVKNDLRKEYDEELKKLKEIIANFKSQQPDKDIIEVKNQLFARITDKAGNSIAFQFLTLSLDINQIIKDGDTVQVVRYIVIDGKKIEVKTGTVKITSIKKDSIYGRAQIISENSGYSIQTGDLLKN